MVTRNSQEGTDKSEQSLKAKETAKFLKLASEVNMKEI